MGSGASSPTFHHNDGVMKVKTRAQSLEVEDQKVHLVRTNKVAPVIIKNCMEEFQHVSEINEPVVYGRIADHMPEHALIQGAYFLVKDVTPEMDILGTMETSGLPNFRKCQGQYPVYGMGQPTRDGLYSLVQTLMEDKNSNVFLINMRQEPVLFAQVGYDMVAYSLRHQDRLDECVFCTSTKQFDTAQFECDIRKEAIELSHFKDDQKFYFYNDLVELKDDPHMYRIAYEDDLAVTEEIYSRLTFNNSHIKYLRMPLACQAPPAEMDIDRFVDLFRHLAEWSKKGSRVPACVFTSHRGECRATFGMVLGCLMLAHKSGFPAEAKKSPFPINERSPNFERGEFHIIRQLVRVLPDGASIKHQVDVIIDQCEHMTNLRTSAAQAKVNLEAIKEDYVIEGISAKDYFLGRCISSLQRYFYLICFNAYLHSQNAILFSESFSQWIRRRTELYHMLGTINGTERLATSKLLLEGTRFLVADDYLGLDVLSSQMEVKTANFRRVPGLSVYGMAQPSREGLSCVVDHLLNKKQGHPSVLWFNLREDLLLECNGSTYSIRESEYLDEPLVIPGVCAREVEDKEEQLKEVVKEHGHFHVYQEIDGQAEERDFNSVLTCVDMVKQQQMQTKQLLYYRLPIPDDDPPPDKFFDELVSIIGELDDLHKDEDGPALLFQCRSGKGRTTTAMAIAGLIVCHLKGFPYGTKPGEEERVSLPNAKYTQGHYQIVQEVVRRIPHGQQVKREVDFVLNQCSDTMTPMHYHAREVIFVTYNKMKKAKTEEERMFLKKRSLGYLERYIYLILFNAYLHCERRNKWELPFSQWMQEVAAQAGMYEVLDNIAFFDFENAPSTLNTKCSRVLFPAFKKLPIRGSIA